MPDWLPLVRSYLEPYAGGISSDNVLEAQQWASNTSSYTAVGSWTAKLVSGYVWVKPIHLHYSWQERAGVLRILMLAARAARDAGQPLPDSELVYASADADPTVAHGCKRSKRRGACAPLPVFVNARNAQKKSSAIPVPEFTWVGTSSAPPWCHTEASIRQAASEQRWSERDDRAYFSGGLSTGRSRQALRDLGETQKDILLVRDVGFSSTGSLGRWQKKQESRSQARQKHVRVRGVHPARACKHKYLISVPGFGYASRLRQLLACGAVVLHVVHASEEFYTPLLRDGVHVVRLDGGDGPGGGPTALRSVSHSLLRVLKQLRANTTYGQRLALAASAFARTWLSFPAVVDYARTLLQEYGNLYKSPVVISAGDGYAQLQSEADLLVAMKLCNCVDDSYGQSCIRQVGAGESFAGTWSDKQGKVLFRRECFNTFRGRRHKLRQLAQQQRCCPLKPSAAGIGFCWEARCCDGWNCQKPLDCPQTASV